MRLKMYRLLVLLSLSGVVLCLLACALAGMGRLSPDQDTSRLIAVVACMLCGFLVMSGIVCYIRVLGIQYENRMSS